MKYSIQDSSGKKLTSIRLGNGKSLSANVAASLRSAGIKSSSFAKPDSGSRRCLASHSSSLAS